jgi:hypothetical protein
MSTQNQILNFKAQVYKQYKTKNGGIVTIYLITPPTILQEFYVATFDDGFSEEAWGLGHTPKSALENASKEWKVYNPDDDNPFEGGNSD